MCHGAHRLFPTVHDSTRDRTPPPYISPTMADPAFPDLDRHHAAAHGGEQILDLFVVGTLLDLGGEEGGDLVAELAELYLDTSITRVGELEEAFEEGDLERVGRIAQSLAKASANLGALPFSKLCRDVGVGTRHQEDNRTRDLVSRLNGMHAEVVQALESLSSDCQD